MRGLHWATLWLLACVFALAWCIDLFEEHGLRGVLRDLHRWAGMLVLVISIVRLALRWMTRLPRRAHPVWLGWLAGLGHAGLYLLLLVQPAIGWAYSDAAGRPLPAPAGFVLPRLLAPNEDLADDLFRLHQVTGKMLLVMIGLHAAAALTHHFIRGDDTLVRMLPSLRLPGHPAPLLSIRRRSRHPG